MPKASLPLPRNQTKPNHESYIEPNIATHYDVPKILPKLGTTIGAPIYIYTTYYICVSHVWPLFSVGEAVGRGWRK